jgi:hypothetical protein
VCTLALGLGCVTTMTAVVESILLRPVALPDAGQLVQVYTQDGASGMAASAHALSYSTIDALRRNNRSFTGVAGYNTMVHPVRTGSDMRVTPIVEVTPDLFSVMGQEAKLGRLLTSKDSDGQVAVVSEGSGANACIATRTRWARRSTPRESCERWSVCYLQGRTWLRAWAR